MIIILLFFIHEPENGEQGKKENWEEGIGKGELEMENGGKGNLEKYWSLLLLLFFFSKIDVIPSQDDHYPALFHT